MPSLVNKPWLSRKFVSMDVIEADLFSEVSAKAGACSEGT